MPCDYCLRNNIQIENPHQIENPQFAYRHTLSRCRVIIPQVEYHHRVNMEQAQFPVFQYEPQYTIPLLRTPLLRRLAKKLGTNMGYNIPRLREFCIEYYQSVRRAYLLSHPLYFPPPPPPTQPEQPIQNQNSLTQRERVNRFLANITNVDNNTQENTPVSTPINVPVLNRPAYLSNLFQQEYNAIPVGTTVGSDIVMTDAIPVGTTAGQNYQQRNHAIPVGTTAGQNYQQRNHAIPVGTTAGQNYQQRNHAIPVGTNAGQNYQQGNNTVAIGNYPGTTEQQGNNTVAIGNYPGTTEQQGNNTVAIGNYPGTTEQQGNYTVAIGRTTNDNGVNIVSFVDRRHHYGRQQPPQHKVVLRMNKQVGMEDNNNAQKSEAEEDTTCCICMETNTYIKTNCGHTFCNCILQHLSKNGVSCPMCRQKVCELNYGDAEHLDTTVKMLPMLPVPLQNLFKFEEIV